MKIDKIKLANLHTYFKTGGSTEPEDVMEHLETEDEAVMAAYIAALKKKYPSIYDTDTEEEEAEEDGGSYTYFLKESGFPLKELELVRQKGDKLYFAVKEPKDIVTVVIKGVPTEVDLIQLAKHPGDNPHGILNSKLIELAQLAR